MITDLKQKLRELRANRLINYGNTAYQRISNDWHFENVPTELRELWYGQDVVSFITLSIAYDSDIDRMSHNELVRWIDNEYCLIARLEKVFSNLEKKESRNCLWQKLTGIEPLRRFSNKKRNLK